MQMNSTAEDTFLNCGYLIVKHICPPTLKVKRLVVWLLLVLLNTKKFHPLVHLLN